MYEGFKKLTINEFELYQSYLKQTKGDIPSTLYFTEVIGWDFYNPNYFCEIEGYLCILVYFIENAQVMFLPPIGAYQKETFLRVISRLFWLSKKAGYPLLFLDVSEFIKEKLLELIEYQIIIKDSECMYDYYYSYQDFMETFQKSSVRYAYRYFERNYSPCIYYINEKNKKVCKDITRQYYCKTHNCSDCKYGCEIAVIETILSIYQKLKLTGILIEGKGEWLGFIIAEQYKEELIVHFKKNIHKVRGINEYIHYHLFELFKENKIKWINYTDDMNIPGLREYKRNLAPYCLKPRYLIELKLKKEL